MIHHQALQELNQSILRACTEEEIIDLAFRHLNGIFHCPRLSIVQFSGDKAIIRGIRGILNPGFKAGDEVATELFGNPAELKKWIPQFVDISTGLKDLPPIHDDPRFEGIKAYYVIPLIADRTLFGVMNISLQDNTPLDREILDHIRIISYSIALGLNKERLNSELRKSEEKFRHILENQSDMIVQIDSDGRYTYVSPSFVVFTGLSEEELTGSSCFRLILESDRPMFIEKMEQLKHQPYTLEHEERLMTTRGMRWVSWSDKADVDPGGNIKSVQGIGRDISESRMAEKKMAHMAAIVTYSEDAVISKDPQGRILTWNNGAEKIYGYDSGEIIGRNISILVPHDLEGEEKEIISRIMAGEILDHFETRRKTKNGRIINISLTVSPIYNKKKEIIAISTIARDITEKKKIEKDFIEAKNRSEESDKLKSAFLANMSHEIRTPLNAILGFSQLLTDESHDLATRNFFTEQINKGSQDLLRLVENIIEASRLESDAVKIRPQVFNVNDKIRELYIENLQFHPLRRDHLIEFNLKLQTDDNLVILADLEKIQKIFTELIDNAWKFTENGFIEMGTCGINSSGICYYVKDSGIGISPELGDKVFDRFFKNETSRDVLYRGTGIGLNLAKKFTELLGGNIIFESVPGKGSTFYFTLPAQIESKGFVVENEKVVLHAETNGKPPKRVLVAEDVDSNYFYIEEVFGSHGITTLWAKNGSEAVTMVEEDPLLDLILMDLRMPVMDGYEATIRIKEINPDIPVIAQTAFTMDRAEVTMKNNLENFDDYLTKPVNLRTLNHVIKKYLA